MIIEKLKTLNILLLILTFCLIGFISCMVTRAGSGNMPDLYAQTETDQIIFLNYSVKLDKSKGDYNIRLLNKTIARGRLKVSPYTPEIRKPGDLRCVSLNYRMEPLDSIIISDPLNITVESVDVNNALFKKEIALDSAQFSVRMQLNDKIMAFGIKKNSDIKNQKSYLLITKIK